VGQLEAVVLHAFKLFDGLLQQLDITRLIARIGVPVDGLQRQSALLLGLLQELCRRDNAEVSRMPLPFLTAERSRYR
jgi:hypothetical protein